MDQNPFTTIVGCQLGCQFSASFFRFPKLVAILHNTCEQQLVLHYHEETNSILVINIF